jgi:hypothetical protein
MPKIAYQTINFKPATLALIQTCENILDDYERQGYDMTLRQLYYQLVSRDIIPNKQTEYKRLGSIINDARLYATKKAHRAIGRLLRRSRDTSRREVVARPEPRTH